MNALVYYLCIWCEWRMHHRKSKTYAFRKWFSFSNKDGIPLDEVGVESLDNSQNGISTWARVSEFALLCRSSELMAACLLTLQDQWRRRVSTVRIQFYIRTAPFQRRQKRSAIRVPVERPCVNVFAWKVLVGRGTTIENGRALMSNETDEKSIMFNKLRELWRPIQTKTLW